MPIFPEMIKQRLSSTALRSIGWSLNAMAQVSQPMAGEWALKVFTRPRTRISSVHDPDIFKGSEQPRLSLSNYPLEVQLFRWPGNGPRVLLAHGWESNSSRWLPLIRALQRLDYELISLDAPAHGLSGGQEFNVVMYTEVLREVWQEYQPDFFIGHSAGGMAGVYHLYQERQSDVQGLILMAVPHELEDLMDTFRQIVGMNDEVFSGLKNAFEERFGFPMSAFSIPDFVRRVQAPGLLIHDMDDTIAAYAGGLDIHRNWKGSEMFSTNGLGHSLPGKEVLEVILGYLQRKILHKAGNS